MSRNLLPSFRSKPNPANIQQLPPGRWSPLQNPEELAKLELAARDDAELRTHIQSIPSPWARLHLFHNAFRDTDHPARQLAQNEILDALEFLWSHGGAGVSITRARLDELAAIADHTGSPRVRDFADALVKLAPRRTDGTRTTALPSISVVVFDGVPMMASSPYTLLFTAEDAGGTDKLERAGAPGLFRYARGIPSRALAERPLQFQRYLAQVLMPQLEVLAARPDGLADGDEYVSGKVLRSGVGDWLMGELSACRAAQSNPVIVQQLTPPREPGGWSAAARELKLEPISTSTFGGVRLFRRPPGEEMERSRWRVRSRVDGAPATLALDPQSFDGRYFEGAQPVKLPADLARLNRKTLPVLGKTHEWVTPATDWLTDRLFLLAQPLDVDAVKGLRGYGATQSTDARFTQPRLALPLRGEFFRHFRPDDVDDLLTVQALSDGSVAVSLTVPVGPDDDQGSVTVRRVYPDAAIEKQYGPELAAWPAFRHPSWREYAVFRIDRSPHAADYVELRAMAGGAPLSATDTARRTPLVRSLAFAAAPEVLEFHRAGSGGGESLGVVLPRFAAASEPNETRFLVGVDFGTSNTIISIRENDDPTSRIFSAESLVLGVTRDGAETADFRAGYFFPQSIAGEPFGTAVVHMEGRPHLDLAREPIAVRVTVPFTGLVRNENQNQVTGDLKWSPERETYFLSAVFLRHVVATVLAEALRQGVRSRNVSILFSYPRAFSEEQRQQLEAQWREVTQVFLARGMDGLRVAEGGDESKSVLRHFFNSADVGTLGAGDVILDVGGGTTDLAAYGESRVLLLDSVLLGGKNLTGQRQQGASSEDLTNRFVEAFLGWARENDLPAADLAVLDKYLADRQVHLAFTYLVRTAWFREGKAALFLATREFRSFQAIVFYFFAALFHYVGLSFRALPPTVGSTAPRLPEKVTLAGNGSQYLHWLSGLRPGKPGDLYRVALSEILRAAAGAEEGPVVQVVVTPNPKEEVARGLVAKVTNHNLDAAPATSGPIIGERIEAQLGGDGTPRTLEAVSRLGAAEMFRPRGLASVRWLDGETEADRFHASLLRAAESLTPLGDSWAELPRRYRELFASMNGAALRTATMKKLEYLVNLGDGYRGSLFIVEVTVMMEHALATLFGERR